MRLDTCRVLLIAASLFVISFPVSSQPSPVDVVERLKAGGAVIYFRHGDTKASVSRLPGCESERNLSDTGRDDLLRLLTTPPAGAIRVLVAHHSNLIAAVGIALQEGEAAVFTPPASPGEGPRLFARIKPAEWPGLATVAKR
jgi:hypothetical protein